MPLPSVTQQGAAVSLLLPERNVLATFQRILTSQADLIAERRQALITAAVTGELDIPGVAA
jgi:type I restriction enzyme, S subunit